jgi:hypothetical protein
MWHAILFFGIAKFSKLGMQNPFSGLQFAFFACNINFQTCGNDPPKKKNVKVCMKNLDTSLGCENSSFRFRET